MKGFSYSAVHKVNEWMHSCVCRNATTRIHTVYMHMYVSRTGRRMSNTPFSVFLIDTHGGDLHPFYFHQHLALIRSPCLADPDWWERDHIPSPVFSQSRHFLFRFFAFSLHIHSLLGSSVESEKFRPTDKQTATEFEFIDKGEVSSSGRGKLSQTKSNDEVSECGINFFGWGKMQYN